MASCCEQRTLGRGRGHSPGPHRHTAKYSGRTRKSTALIRYVYGPMVYIPQSWTIISERMSSTRKSPEMPPCNRPLGTSIPLARDFLEGSRR